MTITKKNEVTLTVKRTVQTKDGAGGYLDSASPVEITGSPFAARKIIPRKETAVAGLQAAAGLAVTKDLVFVFQAGSALLEGDICYEGTKTYTIMAIRSYTRSVQAEVKAV